MSRLARLLFPAVVLLAAYYAVFGGEYSLLELRRARAAEERERRELAELERQIDSLRAWADSMEVDPVTLERLARERFGMIREGEVLYRIVEPDTATVDSVGADPDVPGR